VWEIGVISVGITLETHGRIHKSMPVINVWEIGVITVGITLETHGRIHKSMPVINVWEIGVITVGITLEICSRNTPWISGRYSVGKLVWE
jgi:precorrin-6B methylase 2